jgi:hypothetical protein
MRLMTYKPRLPAQTETSSAARAGAWYEDPYDEATLRWWDGSRWTEHVWSAGDPTGDQAGTSTVTAGVETTDNGASPVPQAEAETVDEALAALASSPAPAPAQPETPEQSDLVRRVLLAVGSIKG